jgi:hypothetical protein
MTCMHTSRRSFLTSAATFAAVGAHTPASGLPATQKATSAKARWRRAAVFRLRQYDGAASTAEAALGHPDSTNPDSTNACGDDRHATARAGGDGEDAVRDVAALRDKVIREATIQVH